MAAAAAVSKAPTLTATAAAATASKTPTQIVTAAASKAPAPAAMAPKALKEMTFMAPE